MIIAAFDGTQVELGGMPWQHTFQDALGGANVETGRCHHQVWHREAEQGPRQGACRASWRAIAPGHHATASDSLRG